MGFLYAAEVASEEECEVHAEVAVAASCALWAVGVGASDDDAGVECAVFYESCEVVWSWCGDAGVGLEWSESCAECVCGECVVVCGECVFAFSFGDAYDLCVFEFSDVVVDVLFVYAECVCEHFGGAGLLCEFVDDALCHG